MPSERFELGRKLVVTTNTERNVPLLFVQSMTCPERALYLDADNLRSLVGYARLKGLIAADEKI